MHELSFVTNIVHMVEEVRQQHPEASVTQVDVSIGAATGALPEYLIKYYTEVTEGTPLQGSVLNATIIPVKGRCLDCGTEYHPDRAYRYRCPSCGSGKSIMIEGKDIVINSVVFGDTT